jgi:beta-galactosidase/beta-glucuronidase
MNNMKKNFSGYIFCSLISILVLIPSCKEDVIVKTRELIDLSGSWRFALDSTSLGIAGKWYNTVLSDSVRLPGTLDENKKGIPNTNCTETMRLSREMMYSGMAWYQKEITVPANWSDKRIVLTMERTKPTQVWVDTLVAGSSNDLLTAQNYDLSALLTPGKHKITILVNNGNGSVPRGITGSHSWTEHTQSNWNGIIGKFCLEASDAKFIES